MDLSESSSEVSSAVRHHDIHLKRFLYCCFVDGKLDLGVLLSNILVVGPATDERQLCNRSAGEFCHPAAAGTAAGIWYCCKQACGMAVVASAVLVLQGFFQRHVSWLVLTLFNIATLSSATNPSTAPQQITSTLR